MALRFGFAALIGIVLVSLSGPALSQLAVSEGESATPPPALSEQFSAPRMALIDLAGVLRASNGTLRVRELLDEQRLLFQAEFAEREAGLQQAERRLQTARDSISEEEFSDRLSAFEDEVALIQREIQYRREALDLAFQDAQARLRQIAIEIVADIAREQKLDLVLKEDSTMVFRPGLNISEEVLRRLDERTKDARIEIEVDNGTDSTLGADQ